MKQKNTEVRTELSGEGAKRDFKIHNAVCRAKSGQGLFSRLWSQEQVGLTLFQFDLPHLSITWMEVYIRPDLPPNWSPNPQLNHHYYPPWCVWVSQEEAVLAWSKVRWWAYQSEKKMQAHAPHFGWIFDVNPDSTPSRHFKKIFCEFVRQFRTKICRL